MIRPALACITFTLALVSLLARAETLAVPRCRLDDSLRVPVHEAFESIRSYWPTASLPELPFESLTVNGEPSAGGLRLALIRDASVGQVTEEGCVRPGALHGALDVLSITGVCEPDGPQSLRCSAGALRSLIEADPQKRHPNLGLALVLAHELSHLVHKDPGAFVSPVISMEGTLSQKDKWMVLMGACDSSEPETSASQLRRETHADDEALAVVERIVAAQMQAETSARPTDMRSLLLGSVEASLVGLRQWQARWLGRRDLPPIESPTADDDVNRFAEWVADRRLCDVLEPFQGTALVPQAQTNHPLATERLSKLSLRLASLPAPSPRDAPIDHAGVGNASDLLGRMAGVLAVVDRQEAEVEARSTEAFCKRVHLTPPDCGSVPRSFPRAPHTCPEFHATVQWSPLQSIGEASPVRREGQALGLGARTLTFARPLADGTVIVGATSGLGFVGKAGDATWFELPCVPRDMAETDGGALVLCDHPLGIIRTSRTAPLAWGRATQPTFQGEPDEESSGLRWMGRVEGHFLALFSSGSGTTQTIDVSTDHWITAAPWQGQGCEVLVQGMIVGMAGGRITGASSGQPSVPRTARFDARFQTATTFTARAKPESITCGLGPSGPLCLAGDGRLLDPEPKQPRLVARLALAALVGKGTLRHASLCTAGGEVWVLLIENVGGEPVSEVHVVRGAVAQRVLRKPWVEEGSLRCAGEEATVTLSSGSSSELYRFRARPLPSASQRH